MSETRESGGEWSAPGGRARRGSQVERAIVRKVGRAIGDFDMISDGDRIMVCVSGGKDSYGLLAVLRLLRERAPVSFDLLAVNVSQGWPGYRADVVAEHVRATGVELEVIEEDFASIADAHLDADDTPCSLCSRLRRGVLYSAAVRLGCSKIALGHHMDDLLETLMLNLFYSGRLASMAPRLTSDDGRNTVIRPLAYVPEAALVEYAAEKGFPLVRCACPSCGQPDQKRQVVKRMLAELEVEQPGIKSHMLAALGNVKPSHLLDRRLVTALGKPAAAGGDANPRSPDGDEEPR